MLKYKSLKTINIRKTPAVIYGVNSNDIGDIPANTEFIGSSLVTGANGVKYIELVSVGGVNKTGFVSTLASIMFIEDTGNPPPLPTEPVFPEWFTLTDPNGVKARYDFVRILP